MQNYLSSSLSLIQFCIYIIIITIIIIMHLNTIVQIYNFD